MTGDFTADKSRYHRHSETFCQPGQSAEKHMIQAVPNVFSLMLPKIECCLKFRALKRQKTLTLPRIQGSFFRQPEPVITGGDVLLGQYIPFYRIYVGYRFNQTEVRHIIFQLELSPALLFVHPVLSLFHGTIPIASLSHNELVRRRNDSCLC